MDGLRAAPVRKAMDGWRQERAPEGEQAARITRNAMIGQRVLLVWLGRQPGSWFNSEGDQAAGMTRKASHSEPAGITRHDSNVSNGDLSWASLTHKCRTTLRVY